MTDPLPLPEQCLRLIDQIVQMTLKGQIRSKEQVHQMLLQGVEPGTGELFERCLSDRITSAQTLTQSQTDELKLAKAQRRLRALQTIQGEWERVQAHHRDATLLVEAVHTITAADPGQRLQALVRVLDPNRPQALSLVHLKQLTKILQQQVDRAPDLQDKQQLQELTAGLRDGIAAWQRLEAHLVSWIYNQGQARLGFEGIPGQRGPWMLWANQVQSLLPQALFQALALGQPLEAGLAQQSQFTLADWVELAIVLQALQRGLVAWFDQRVYNPQLGSKLSVATFLVFAILWSQLAIALRRYSGLAAGAQEDFAQSCFRVTLQILRTFAQREYFPLYGGIFASFTGEALRDALRYLDEPLRQAEGTQEKARILTLLGYSLRAQGQYGPAIAFHEQALAIARAASDSRCEIANLNHLSRIAIAQKAYGEAIHSSQRALMLSRQGGDRQGEANALANLGYSEVLTAQAANQADREVYEAAIAHLDQGLKRSEQLQDPQSQALCASSLGIAQLVLGQPEAAIAALEIGWQAAQFSGDLYLQGLNLAYLAEAHYSLQTPEIALYMGSLAMYLLEQVGATEWRKPAGLLTVLQGQLGPQQFETSLQQQRSKILPLIGVDGFDHIPELLAAYQRSL